MYKIYKYIKFVYNGALVNKIKDILLLFKEKLRFWKSPRLYGSGFGLFSNYIPRKRNLS